MKNFTKKLVFAAIAVTSVGWAQPKNKVTVCHVPPGNPQNAHNITISQNALQAHIPGNNQHSDFLGDCFSGCQVMEVVSVNQGKQSDMSDVPGNRSNSLKVLDIDGANQDGGFFSLGFGGSITVKMNGGILNRPGNDLRIYETSFGQPACANYPETAEIWVSKDNVSWHLAGTLCQDGEVDIAPLDWILYVRVVDVSDPAGFSGVVDGFDLDGISCVPFSQNRLAEPYADVSAHLSVYPNPSKDVLYLSVHELSQSATFEVQIQDLGGRTLMSKSEIVDAGDSQVKIDLSGVGKGIHLLTVRSEEVNLEQKIIVE